MIVLKHLSKPPAEAWNVVLPVINSGKEKQIERYGNTSNNK
jgi:hypothetical protein